MSNKSKVLLWVGLASASLIFYQNCAQNDMSFTSTVDSHTIDDDIIGGGPREIVEIPEEEEFIPSEIEEFSCQSYVEYDMRNGSGSTPLEIPARSASGECYVLKLIDALASTPSPTSNLERDTEVISRDHDIKNNDHRDRNYPYTMGKVNLHIKLNGQRNILLSGDSQGLADILVDNFILVGVKAVGGRNDYYRQYLAYGTSDSSIVGDGNKIAFRDSVVELLPFASKGTSSIAPLALENRISVGHFYQFDIRALDAGGTARLSDIYMIIR